MTSPAGSAGTIAERIAEAASGIAGVAGLHGGAFGEVATYLPGRRIEGVRLTDRLCEVHIVVLIPADLPAVAEAVRAQVAPLVEVPVQVTVEDVRVGGREGAES
ncbi:hypothetical protein OED52_15505 [Rhodococcus sp. Z13]|uniref:Uncharacterized protein n=1 Tax=Rhodococcus sacchari TaxID=2962047 RepID=A0ACD4DDK1_9NOCA|nr:hypothetical protein [Rhodococcus sp. Z13]UYP18064.1 hypothetical protein OED52_15505 [Rhodococcus sp. Z13]